jgi:hypothetical protein
MIRLLVLCLFFTTSLAATPFLAIKAGGGQMQHQSSESLTTSLFGISFGSKRDNETFGLEIFGGVNKGDLENFRMLSTHLAYQYIPFDLIVLKLGAGAAGAHLLQNETLYSSGPYLNSLSTIAGVGLNMELINRQLWTQLLLEYDGIWNFEFNRDFDIFSLSLQLLFF